MKHLVFLLFLIGSGCGVKSRALDFQVPLNPTKCQHLPSEAIVDPSTNCTTNSGLWTAYDLIVQNHQITGGKYCNLSGNGNPPQNQRDFNINYSSQYELSDNDFHKESTCASGSTFLSTSSGGYFRVRIWEVAP
jgi:hypothetical protein